VLDALFFFCRTVNLLVVAREVGSAVIFTDDYNTVDF
jgi:hypothetical protein